MGPHGVELSPGVAGLAAAVCIVPGLGVGDAGALRFLGRLGLGLGRRAHESDERIPHGLLHRVLGGAVEDQAVDDRADDDAAAHQLTDGVGHVLVVAAKPVDPPDHKYVAAPEHVEEATPLRPIGEPGADAAHALIRHDHIDREARGLGLGALVASGLLRGAHAGVEDGLRHDRIVR